MTYYWETMSLSATIGIWKNNSVPSMGYLFLSWSVGSIQTSQATAISLGHPPELDRKTILLKTPYAWVIGYGKLTGTDLEAPTLLAGFHSARTF